jgi:hypothetical protein
MSVSTDSRQGRSLAHSVKRIHLPEQPPLEGAPNGLPTSLVALLKSSFSPETTGRQ